MQMRFLHLVRLLGVAAQADAHRVGLQEPGVLAGVRIVAIGAVARRAWMLHLGLLDLLAPVGVAGDAEGLGVRAASARLCRLSPARGRYRTARPQMADA